MSSKTETARGHWRRIVEDQRQSGMSMAGFCRERGLAMSSLFAWKRRLAREAATAAAPAFVRVEPAVSPSGEIAAAWPDGGIELHLGGGRHFVLRPGFDPATLAAALAVLEGR